jgi:precorrin-6B methylase 2
MIPPSVAVFEKAQHVWISKAISVACDLNIADILVMGPKKIEEIAATTHTNEQALYRLLRALASEGIFKESKGFIFSNTALSKGLANGKGSMKNMIRHQFNPTNWEIIGKLDFAISTGKSAAIEILGTDVFSHLEKNPDKNELYNKAMTDTSALSSAAFLAAYSFKNHNLIVDVGGGEGYLLSIILNKHKPLRGIVFDLPHVVKAAAANFSKFGLNDRVTIAEGDFFNTVPKGGDVYIMKNILHAFDDQLCKNILENIAKAMEKGATLLIMEAVIEENNQPAFGKLVDLQMLISTNGGKERTKKEFEVLLKNSGFMLKKVIPTVSPFSIVEGRKL